MAKKNSAQSRGASDPKTDEKPKPEPRDSLRETVESIVIAFVLAFLFRTFEAEAFVIPTGSMAPTLMGRHKDLICSNCQYPYRVSASDEEPRNGDAWRNLAEEEAHKVVSSICPVCRYQMHFGPGGREASWRHASYKGDRILVAKFPYEFADPNRWDVAVFKNPGKAKENYIKRIVGLPNETVVLCRGDIHTTQEDLDYEPLNAAVVAELRRQGLLQIERKPPAKVEAMLQVVHDNDYLPPRLPARWEAQTPDWETVDEGKGFECDGQAAGDAMLLYNHLAPSPGVWRQIRDDPDVAPQQLDIRPRLITDFYAYNTNVIRQMSGIGLEDDVFGNHWVGDLAIECRMQVKASQGEAILQLVEAGRVFECRIDVATGKARFNLPGEAAPEVQTVVRGPGSYRLRFANVDDQLLLWVNGKSVSFDGRYEPQGNPPPNEEDLAPARLGSRALAVRFDRIRLLRDVFYIASNRSEAAQSASFFTDPSQWGQFTVEPAIAFALSADRFLVLGDNSPRSADSRMWMGRDEQGAIEYYVKRELLVGKALYVYWPHALDHLPGLPNVWFPFFPNFARMGFVR